MWKKTKRTNGPHLTVGREAWNMIKNVNNGGLGGEKRKKGNY